MIKILFLTLVCLLSAVSGFAFSFPADTVKVLVKDESDKPVKAVKVTVHTYPSFYSDAKGSYLLKIKEELEMPFDVFTESKEYETLKFSYYKDAKEIVVKVKKKNAPSTPAASTNKVTAATTAVAPAKPLTPPTAVVAAAKPKEGTVKESIVATSTPAVAATPAASATTQPKDSANFSVTYKQYKGDFEKITQQVYKERERLVINNDHIKEEIAKITDRLNNEKNLSKAERAKLREYLEKLEKEFEKNAIAFRKAEEQTKVLIDQLKMMLAEKDALNAITANQLKAEQAKRLMAERRNTRSFTIFSIITFFLLLLAISFYSIARKMRKQRTNLLQSNHELNEQKKLIEDQNKQLDHFAYRASHDIKGPLKSIMAVSDLAKQTIDDDSSKELFDMIHKSSLKLDTLVTDMLMMAKDSQSQLSFSTVQIAEVVNEVLQDLKSIDGYESMNLTTAIPSELTVEADSVLFHSVVQNIIENAIKYSDKKKEKKTLHISAAQEEKHVAFSFKDNGVGIPEQFHEKVFSSFFRNSHDSNGTGLGLYIVKQNVEKMGGTITVQSSPGEGSNFIVKLPLR